MSALRRPLAYIVPRPEFRGAIDRIWSCTADAGPAPTLLPGTGAELVLQRRPTLQKIGSDGTPRRLPPAFVFCFRSRVCRLRSDGPVDFVAVRFRGSAIRHFARLQLADLADRVTPAGSVFGPEIDGLTERLAQIPDLATCAVELFTFLRHRRRERSADARAADAVLEALYYAEASRPVADLVEELGWSMRQLERIVGTAAGLPPKRFRRLARFHHTMRQLHLDARREYLATALAQGYHDQAHFIHECREFTGCAPGQVLTPGQFASHFYNPSLPR